MPLCPAASRLCRSPTECREGSHRGCASRVACSAACSGPFHCCRSLECSQQALPARSVVRRDTAGGTRAGPAARSRGPGGERHPVGAGGLRASRGAPRRADGQRRSVLAIFARTVVGGNGGRRLEASDLEHGSEDYGRFGDNDEQGARSDRGTMAVRPFARADRPGDQARHGAAAFRSGLCRVDLPPATARHPGNALSDRGPAAACAARVWSRAWSTARAAKRAPSKCRSASSGHCSPRATPCLTPSPRGRRRCRSDC